MSQEPQNADQPSSPTSSGQQQQQQQQQPQPEGHAGEGSDSILKQLREWEHRRASNSGGKRRNGPA